MVEIDPIYKLEGKQYSLNLDLINKKGLSQKQVNKIKELHIERLMTEAQLDRQYDSSGIYAWYKVWEQIQFDLQKAWGFAKDSTYHPSHLLSICSCPKLDNSERLGSLYKLVSSDCKLHNALMKKK